MGNNLDKLVSRIKQQLDTQLNKKIKLNTTEITIRQQLILNRARKNDFSFEEIVDYLKTQSDIHGLDLVLSQRTFQRDLKTIYSVYGVEIKYVKSLNKYSVVFEEQSEAAERMLESVDVYNVLKFTDQFSELIKFETRKSLGTKHLSSILSAIKTRKRIKFTYQKFWRNTPEERVIEPSFLKEHKQRWYIAGTDISKKKIRVFGLDRIIHLEITSKEFEFDAINHSKMYQNSFGIISNLEELPIEISLTFNDYQAKYIKSLPLHHSQSLKKEIDGKIVFSLFLIPTIDFKMELMSFGSNLIDIEPARLKNEIINLHKNALRLLSTK